MSCIQFGKSLAEAKILRIYHPPTSQRRTASSQVKCVCVCFAKRQRRNETTSHASGGQPLTRLSPECSLVRRSRQMQGTNWSSQQGNTALRDQVSQQVLKHIRRAKNLRSSGITQTQSPFKRLKANAKQQPTKAISICQVQGENGIDMCVPSSSSAGTNDQTMASVNFCHANTHFATETIEVHHERKVLHATRHLRPTTKAETRRTKTNRTKNTER